jgi:hypothetical protein
MTTATIPANIEKQVKFLNQSLIKGKITVELIIESVKTYADSDNYENEDVLDAMLFWLEEKMTPESYSELCDSL